MGNKLIEWGVCLELFDVFDVRLCVRQPAVGNKVIERNRGRPERPTGPVSRMRLANEAESGNWHSCKTFTILSATFRMVSTR